MTTKDLINTITSYAFSSETARLAATHSLVVDGATGRPTESTANVPLAAGTTWTPLAAAPPPAAAVF